MLWAMSSEPNTFYAERHDPLRNMARFYDLSIEPTFFGELCVVRRWGRIGAHGRTMRHSFNGHAAALSFLADIARKKQRRGYVTLPSSPHTGAINARLPMAG